MRATQEGRAGTVHVPSSSKTRLGAACAHDHTKSVGFPLFVPLYGISEHLRAERRGTSARSYSLCTHVNCSEFERRTWPFTFLFCRMLFNPSPIAPNNVLYNALCFTDRTE